MSDYRDLILASSPSHYWKFDETSGSVTNEVAGLHGSVNGAITRGVAGRDGNAYYFDGSSANAYVLANGQVISNGQAAYTAMAWFRWDGGGGGAAARPFILETNPNWAISMSVRTSTSKFEVFVRLADGASFVGIDFESNQTIQPGRRYCAHVTYQRNGTLALYIDGKLDNSISTPDLPLADTTDLKIGTYRTANNRWWDGMIDEVAIFPSVLSPSVIEQQAKYLFFIRYQDSLLQPPDTPTNFAIELADSEAHLSWDAMDGADTYTVRRERWTGGGAPPQDPVASLTESFNKADSSVLGPDHEWAEYGGDWEVISNQAVAPAANSAAECQTPLYSTDQSAEVDLSLFSGGNDNIWAGPMVRMPGDGSPTGYLFARRTSGSTGGTRLYRVVNGSFTSIASTSGSGAARLRITVEGDVIKGFVNDTEVLSTTDDVISSGYHVGVGVNTTIGTFQYAFDNFEAEVLGVSDWGESATFDELATTSYQDSTVAAEQWYRYSVEAVNAAGASDATDWLGFYFIQVAGRSASSSRGSASISTPLSVSGRSATSTRSSASLTIPTFLAGRSSSTSRASVAVDVTSQVAARSSTSSRGFLEVGDTSITLAMGSAGGSRSTATLTTAISLTGRSASTSRSSLVLGDTSVGFSGRSSTPSRSTLAVVAVSFTIGSSIQQAELVTAEELSGRSSTSTRAAVALDAAVRPAGRSSTSSRAELELASGVTLAGRSATGSRAATILETGVTLSGRSATSSRSEVDVRLLEFIDLAGISTTTSRASLVQQVPVSLSGRSASSSRASLAQDTEVGLTGVSTTSSRAEVLLSVDAEVAGRSSTGSRGDVALTTPTTTLSGRSATATRSRVVVEVTEIIRLAGVSSTASRSSVAIDTIDITRLDGVSSTASRSSIELDTSVGLSGASTTTSRSSASVEVIEVTRFEGTSSTSSRSQVAIETSVGMAGRSSTSSRAVVDVETIEVTRLSGRSATSSRATVALDTPEVARLTGRSSTTSRSYVDLTTPVTTLSGRSVTSTRASLGVREVASMAGRSSSGSRAFVAVDTSVLVEAASRTASRSLVDLDAGVGVGGRSATNSRSSVDVSIFPPGSVVVEGLRGTHDPSDSIAGVHQGDGLNGAHRPTDSLGGAHRDADLNGVHKPTDGLVGSTSRS